MQTLEEEVGVRLLNRTDAGERMLSQLRPLLDGFDAAIESVNGLSISNAARHR